MVTGSMVEEATVDATGSASFEDDSAMVDTSAVGGCSVACSSRADNSSEVVRGEVMEAHGSAMIDSGSAGETAMAGREGGAEGEEGEAVRGGGADAVKVEVKVELKVELKAAEEGEGVSGEEGRSRPLRRRPWAAAAPMRGREEGGVARWRADLMEARDGLTGLTGEGRVGSALVGGVKALLILEDGDGGFSGSAQAGEEGRLTLAGVAGGVARATM